MEKNDLLHFLIGSADAKTTKEFQEVLADKADDLLKIALKTDQKKAEKLMKMIPKEVKRFEDPSWLRQKTNEYFGKPKSDLMDLSPQELKKLLEVERGDPKDRMDFDLPVSYKSFQPEMDLKELPGRLDKFYMDNKVGFDSPRDLGFDPKTQIIHFNASKELAEKLLTSLGLQETIKVEILNKNFHQQDIEFSVALSTEDFFPGGGDAIAGMVESFKLQHQTGISRLEFDPETQTLSYDGSPALLDTFIKEAMISDTGSKKIKDASKSREKTSPEEEEKVALEIPIPDLSDEEVSLIDSNLKTWLAKKGLTDKTAKLSKDRTKFLFTGTTDRLELLLGRGGLDLSNYKIGQIMNNLQKYKVRL